MTGGRFIRARRAIASVEFALTAYMFLFVLAGATDYGLAMWARSCLTNSLADGAYYAFLTGPTVAGSAVTQLVQRSSSLFAVSATLTTTCYCPSASQGTTLGTQVSCTSTNICSIPNEYLKITGRYNLVSFFPTAQYGGLTGTQVTDSVTVRVR